MDITKVIMSVCALLAISAVSCTIDNSISQSQLTKRIEIACSSVNDTERQKACNEYVETLGMQKRNH